MNSGSPNSGGVNPGGVNPGSPNSKGKNAKAVVLLSGGLDSATAAAQAIADGYDLIALSFRYGQRHERELQAAQQVAQHLGIAEHHT
ncbi:7-cyano-7-deazaguanine synthase, partial [filamentous cyanobacterium CCP1]